MYEDLIELLKKQKTELEETIKQGNEQMSKLFYQGINYEKTIVQLRDENSKLKKELETANQNFYRSQGVIYELTESRVSELGKVLLKEQLPTPIGNIIFYRCSGLPENMVILNPDLHDQFENLILKNSSDYFLIDYELKRIVEKARDSRMEKHV